MMRKLIIILLMMVPLVCACSKDAANREMMAKVNGSEHDPHLFGWWKSHGDESLYYYCFDATTFRWHYFHPDENGELEEYAGEWYWYTEGGVLYSFKKATWKTGIMSSSKRYLLSDDGNMLTLIEVDLETAPKFIKVDHP